MAFPLSLRLPRAFGLASSRRSASASATASPQHTDLLALAAALLREHGGSLEPSLLKSRMRDAWAGAPGQAFPAGIAFVRQFPAVFSIEWGVRRLGAEAVAEFERYARRVRLNADAPVRLLERATAADADPAIYGPLIERELRRAGGYLPLRALTLRLQMAALAEGLRLPPSGVNWFILHPSPHYARLRPVWGGRVQADGYLFNEGIMFVEGGVVAFEAAELRRLAAALEGNSRSSLAHSVARPFQSSLAGASASIVKRNSPGSRAMKPCTTAKASSNRVAGDVGPWRIAAALRPSSSTRKPPRSTKAAKCSCASSTTAL